MPAAPSKAPEGCGLEQKNRFRGRRFFFYGNFGREIGGERSYRYRGETILRDRREGLFRRFVQTEGEQHEHACHRSDRFPG